LYKNIFTIFWRRSQREVIIIIIVSWLSTGDMPSRPDPETDGSWDMGMDIIRKSVPNDSEMLI